MIRETFGALVWWPACVAVVVAADPALPQFAAVAPPDGVRITHAGEIVPTPLAGVAAEALPEFLVDATAFVRPAGVDKRQVPLGEIVVEATADGPLLLAVCFANDGGNPGAWRAERWTEAKFLDGGWLPVAALPMFNSTSPTPEPHLVLVRDCRAGETFKLRTRLSHPPIVIVADREQVTRAVDVEPGASLSEAKQSEAVTRRMLQLLDERRFDDVERWMSRYVDEDPRFPSGRYKIKATNKFFPHRSTTPESQQAAEKYMAAAEAWLAARPDSLAARLVLGRLLIDYSRMIKSRDAAEAAELHRRALEYVYEVQIARPQLSDVYRTYVMLMFEEGWDVDLAKETILSAVDTGAWCPQIIGEGLVYVGLRMPRDAERTKQLRAFFDECTARSPEKYRAALPAACFKDLPSFAESIKQYGITWPEMRSGFEALEALYPDSPVNLLAGTVFAYRHGRDRDFAAQMLARLDARNYREHDVWTEGLVKTCRMWAAPDYAAGDQRSMFDYGTEFLECVRWLPDGRIFVCSHYGKLSTLDPQTGEWTAHDYLSYDKFNYVALQPDGRTVAYGTLRGYATLCEFPSREVLFQTQLPDDSRADIVAVSPDMRRLAVADYSKSDLVIFEKSDEDAPLETDEARRLPKAWGGKSAALIAFCDEGRKIVGYDFSGTVRVLNSDDLAVVKQWQANEKAPPAAACISADGTLLATSADDKFVRVWRLPDGEKLHEFPTRPHRVAELAFSPDGRLLAGGEHLGFDKPAKIRVWDLAGGRTLEPLAGHKSYITFLDFSADGRSLVSASGDDSIRIWDVPAP